MVFPEVELKPGESIHKADERVEKAFEEAGLTLVAFDGLNSFLDISSYCHFFQVPLEDQLGVIVVMAEPWEEKALILVLNVLLEMRMDPDPPGSKMLFQFYSGHETPSVLGSVFGQSSCCQFECRCLPIARFGHEVDPSLCIQLAAVAQNLCREFFQDALSFGDPSAPERIERIAVEDFLRDEECKEPVNSAIALGCLLGESIRGQMQRPTRWERGSDPEPWPAVVAIVDGREESFQPISLLVRSLQKGTFPVSIRESVADFLRRCGESGSRKIDSNDPVLRVEEDAS